MSYIDGYKDGEEDTLEYLSAQLDYLTEIYESDWEEGDDQKGMILRGLRDWLDDEIKESKRKNNRAA
jgi:hypothetical protein